MACRNFKFKHQILTISLTHQLFQKLIKDENSKTERRFVNTSDKIGTNGWSHPFRKTFNFKATNYHLKSTTLNHKNTGWPLDFLKIIQVYSSIKYIFHFSSMKLKTDSS